MKKLVTTEIKNCEPQHYNTEYLQYIYNQRKEFNMDCIHRYICMPKFVATSLGQNENSARRSVHYKKKCS